MKNLVKKNLLLRVDFQNRYIKEKKKAKQVTDFYIVGFLPVMVVKDDDTKENAYIQTPIKIKKDPYARMLNGARVKDLKKIQKIIKNKYNIDVDYSDQVKKIIDKTQEAIDRAVKGQELAGKKIKQIFVINTENKK